jgi:hypothetical protein
MASRYNFRSVGGDATNAIEQLLSQRLAEALEVEQADQRIVSQQEAIRQRDDEIRRRAEEDRMGAALRQQAMAQQAEQQQASLMDRADARAMAFMQNDAASMARAEQAALDRNSRESIAASNADMRREIAAGSQRNTGAIDALREDLLRKQIADKEQETVKRKADADMATREEAAKRAGIASGRRRVRELATGLANNPALPGITGPVQGRIPAFMDPESIKAISEFNQLVNSLAVTEREKLKGQGQISNFEQEMLMKSLSALNRAAGPEITKKQLLEIAQAFEGDVPSDFAREMGMPPPVETPEQRRKRLYDKYAK